MPLQSWYLSREWIRHIRPRARPRPVHQSVWTSRSQSPTSRSDWLMEVDWCRSLTTPTGTEYKMYCLINHSQAYWLSLTWVVRVLLWRSAACFSSPFTTVHKAVIETRESKPMAGEKLQNGIWMDSVVLDSVPMLLHWLHWAKFLKPCVATRKWLT